MSTRDTFKQGMVGQCPECGSETEVIGDTFLDEQCVSCGRIVRGGMLNEE